jgi:hypothetical protein
LGADRAAIEAAIFISSHGVNMKHTVVFSLAALLLLGVLVPRLYSQASGARVTF